MMYGRADELWSSLSVIWRDLELSTAGRTAFAEGGWRIRSGTTLAIAPGIQRQAFRAREVIQINQGANLVSKHKDVLKS